MTDQFEPIGEFDLNQSFTTRLYSRNIEQIRHALVNYQDLIIVDKLVYDIYFKALGIPLTEKILMLEAGEKHKTLKTVEHIHSFLNQHQANRESEILILGGGTITDVAAYAVSTFKRGCKMTLVPTTLLGMVDAAIGGKTAVNSGKIKNLIGTFYPAQDVIIVQEFLVTCTIDNMTNGMAEMIKLWHVVPHLNLSYPGAGKTFAADEIKDYACAKLEICIKDPMDFAERRLLNLGHTFGHIIEAMTNFRIAHGKAVAMGIVMAAKFSNQMGFIDHTIVQEIEHNIRNLGFETRLDEKSRSSFLNLFSTYAGSDKKADGNGLVLVLFKGYREVFVSESLPLSKVLEILPSCI